MNWNIVLAAWITSAFMHSVKQNFRVDEPYALMTNIGIAVIVWFSLEGIRKKIRARNANK